MIKLFRKLNMIKHINRWHINTFVVLLHTKSCIRKGFYESNDLLRVARN